jgi:hypothetical protein
MELAIAVGKHNLSAAPVILAVIVITVVAYFIWQRRKNQANGPGK